MKKLSYSELINYLANHKGVAMIGLSTLTDAKARKTGNPFGQVFKQCRGVGLVGADYQASVNREGERQGVEADYKAESLPWGQWRIPNKVIEHKGQFYLRTQSSPGQRRKSPVRIVAYRNSTGQFLPSEQVKPFLPEAKESSKQESSGLSSGTVWVRTWGFNSIKKVRVNGQTFELVPE
jgi:hypothetical protein